MHERVTSYGQDVPPGEFLRPSAFGHKPTCMPPSSVRLGALELPTAELTALPIAELKRRLAAAGVDSSGCLYKSELVARLTQRPSSSGEACSEDASGAASVAAATAALRMGAAASAATDPPTHASLRDPPRAPSGAATGRHWSHAGQRRSVALGLALAENYNADVDRCLHGYVAMEKYDGFRASWEVAGETAHFRTRGGHRLEPPPAMAALLPADLRLDGELWMGRGRFEQVRVSVWTRVGAIGLEGLLDRQLWMGVRALRAGQAATRAAHPRSPPPVSAPPSAPPVTPPSTHPITQQSTHPITKQSTHPITH